MYVDSNYLKKGYDDLMTRLKANDFQVNGGHYVDRGIQPWDYIISNNLSYLEGNIIKYVSRHRLKNKMEDLLKAQHYLEKLIETSYENLPNS